jgi:hypothetical protein
MNALIICRVRPPSIQYFHLGNNFQKSGDDSILPSLTYIIRFGAGPGVFAHSLAIWMAESDTTKLTTRAQTNTEE